MCGAAARCAHDAGVHKVLSARDHIVVIEIVQTRSRTSSTATQWVLTGACGS